MSRLKRKTLSFLLIFSLLFGIVGIANLDTTYAAARKTHLKKTTVSITVGKTYQQKLLNKSGKTISATKVKWKSSNTSIANINKKGKITAVKKGTVKMTAKYNGKTYSFTVKVTKSSKKKSSTSKASASGTVYWVPDGSVYHKSKKCPTLSRSKTIKSGTVKESGKDRCCKVCG